MFSFVDTIIIIKKSLNLNILSNRNKIRRLKLNWNYSLFVVRLTLAVFNASERKRGGYFAKRGGVTLLHVQLELHMLRNFLIKWQFIISSYFSNWLAAFTFLCYSTCFLNRNIFIFIKQFDFKLTSINIVICFRIRLNLKVKGNSFRLGLNYCIN